MISILEWVAWVISAFLAGSLIYGTFRTIKFKQSVMKATVYQGIFLSVIVVILLFIPFVSKLHLIWIVPISFFLISHFVLRSAIK